MSGKTWEYAVKKMLKADFGTEAVFKLINFHHIDFIVIHTAIRDGSEYLGVALVEAKSTKQSIFYPLDEAKFRAQWENYFIMKDILDRMGLVTTVWLYLKKPDGIRKISFNSYADIAVKY